MVFLSRKEGFGQRATRKYLTSVPVLKDVTSGVDFGRKDFVYFLQIAYVRTSRKKERKKERNFELNKAALIDR